MKIDGTILGYDPGGNEKHGLAAYTYKQGELVKGETLTRRNANAVIDFIVEQKFKLLAIGVDTLTCWSTGESGWRPADRWLREKYQPIVNSIAAANSLYGSMGLNGMAVLIELRMRFPDIIITETHPKVLYYELKGRKYNYEDNKDEMNELASKLLLNRIETKNDHEWDAAISVFAAKQGISKKWKTDLHTIKTDTNERIITPCGKTYYWWPDDNT